MPPLGIEVSARFKSDARQLSEERLDQLDRALGSLSETFGKPHLHSGLGIRRMRRSYFEFHVGRDIRVVFRLKGSEAMLEMIGTHDDVRRFLKSL